MDTLLFDMTIVLNRYAFPLFGTGLIALFMLAVSLCFYFLIERDEVLLYTMPIEILMFLYMFSYGISVSGQEEIVVEYGSRVMYVNFIALSMVTLNVIGFLSKRKLTWVKRSTGFVGIIFGILILFTDYIISSEISFFYHPIALKGDYFPVFLIYETVLVLLLISLIIVEMTTKKNLKEEKLVYIGIVFFSAHLIYTAITTVQLRLFRPSLYISVLGYSVMIILYFYKHVEQTLRSKEKLFNQYIYDDLTGVYSRNYFFESLNKDTHKLQTNDVLIGMMDMNHFKSINDTFGHSVGDRVLQKTGNILSNIHKNIVVGRIGGDEFMVYSKGLYDYEVKALMLKAIEDLDQFLINEKIVLDGVDIGMSFGFIKYDKTMDMNSLITLCDRAMYDAKESGNNRILFID